MSEKYILAEDGKTPVMVENLLEWADWFKDANANANNKRRVNRTTMTDCDGAEIKISTVFLALDHNYGDSPVPILFETMIFGGRADEDCKRCATWEQAEAQHQDAIDYVTENYPGLAIEPTE